MYRPLADCLTIKESKIEGLGLFATKDIPKGYTLGTSHIRGTGDWMRTPLGGFYNHSVKANCIKRTTENGKKKWIELVTIKDIKAGEEITVSYTFYQPGEKDEKISN